MAKNKTDPKVIIGVACQDLMKSTTAHSIGRAIIGDPTIIDFLMMKSCDIVSSRTWLVKEAIKRGATHLIFVDSDMEFPQDAFQKLLAHEKSIVGVDYNKRKFPQESVLTLRDGVPKSETELYRVAVAGTGLMAIDLSIFTSALRPWTTPYFNFGRDKEGSHVLGEDAWFCYSAQDLGYEVFVDPTIRVFHLGEYGY
jgi:hypothetical protein